MRGAQCGLDLPDRAGEIGRGGRPGTRDHRWVVGHRPRHPRHHLHNPDEPAPTRPHPSRQTNPRGGTASTRPTKALCYTVTHGVTGDRRRGAGRDPGLRPGVRGAPDHGLGRGPPGGRLPHVHLPALAGRAVAGRRPDEPGVAPRPRRYRRRTAAPGHGTAAGRGADRRRGRRPARPSAAPQDPRGRPGGAAALRARPAGRQPGRDARVHRGGGPRRAARRLGPAQSFVLSSALLADAYSEDELDTELGVLLDRYLAPVREAARRG